MIKPIENLEYLLDVCYDLHDASDGEVMPAVSKQDVEDLQELITKRSAQILTTVAYLMTEKDAGCPNTIAELIHEQYEITEEQWNLIHALASSLVKEPGQYE